MRPRAEGAECQHVGRTRSGRLAGGWGPAPGTSRAGRARPCAPSSAPGTFFGVPPLAEGSTFHSAASLRNCSGRRSDGQMEETAPRRAGDRQRGVDGKTGLGGCLGPTTGRGQPGAREGVGTLQGDEV